MISFDYPSSGKGRIVTGQLVGGVILVLIMLSGLLSFFWTPADPSLINIANRMQPPSAAAWLGTDHFGRDILSQIMAATPVTLSVALIGVFIGMMGGIPLGLIAAFNQKPAFDHILTRGGDVLFAFPAVIMAMLLTAGFGAGISIAMLAIGLFNIPVFLRMTRASAMQQQHMTYILSARLAGKSTFRIAAEHILPNIAPLLILQATIQFSLAILAEAGLSYLGLGAQPPIPSWGRMLADSQTMIGLAPHMAIAPGLTIMLTVIGINLIGEGWRQRIDPHHMTEQATHDTAPTKPDGHSATPPASPMEKAPDPSLLMVRNLSVRHQDSLILSPLSLSINQGDRIGLIGASGAGKSILSLAIMGLLPPDFHVTGQIQINGKDVDITRDAMMRPYRGKSFAMIFQDPRLALNPIQGIAAQIAEAAELSHGISRKDAEQMAQHSLNRVGLTPDIVSPDSLPDMLSGGQCQRVMIAMAIIGKPQLLIADEPTTSLDTVTQAGILTLLNQLAEEDNMALLMISHDLAILAEMVEQIYVLDQGRQVDYAASPPFAQTLTHPVSRTLLAASRIDQHHLPDLSDADMILTATQLSKQYASGHNMLGIAKSQKPVLEDMTLTLAQGECLGLVGESGSGKSTLTRLLLGLEHPDHGTVTLGGHAIDPDHMTPVIRRRISAVFQDPYSAFNPRHRVRRIIAEPLWLMPEHLTERAITEKVAEALQSVGLQPDMMHRHIHSFSGGQRQRIAIARALITSPDIIIFDESTSSLDTLIRQQILTLITDLVADHNLSVIFISHDLAVIRAICHRVMVLKDGQCVEMGRTEAIFNHPRHPATRQLLDAIPDQIKQDSASS
ncbi:MAG: nickel ABC transporter ATP-binding protein NikE [Candidatus Puniceispirillales bacterium]